MVFSSQHCTTSLIRLLHKVVHIQEHVLTLRDLTMFKSAVRSVQHQITFKIAHIQEHVLPLYDLTMLNSAVSSVQHQITLR
jgi:hypothetical protein